MTAEAVEQNTEVGVPFGSIDYTPVGNVADGEVVPLTGRCGIAVGAIAAGVAGLIRLNGSWRVNMRSGDVYSLGQTVYWDNANNRTTTLSLGNTLLGFVVGLPGDGQVDVMLGN